MWAPLRQVGDFIIRLFTEPPREVKPLSPEEAAALRANHEREHGRLILSDDGFCLQRGGDRLFDVQWAEVESIVAYKRDFIGYDSIYVAFQIGHDALREIHEEMVDFMEVGLQLPKRFPGVDEEWYFKVMDPPFEANVTLLWQRPAGND